MRTIKSMQVTNKHVFLILCLFLPVIIWLRLQLDTSTGHMDEYDYLFVGKTLSDGLDWPTHTYIFGWDLTWYFFAWGDTQFGGLVGARVISATFGATSLLGMYVFVWLLWKNHTAALISTLLLGLEAAHLYSSKLVSYDIVSFTYFVWALPALMMACQKTKTAKTATILWIVVSSLLLCAAVLSKYTTAVYLPIFAALVLYQSPRRFLVGVIIIFSVLASYAWIHSEQLFILYEIQIKQAHSHNALWQDILYRTINQLMATFALSLLAIVMALKYHLCRVRIIVLLICLACPLFIYHLHGRNVISLQKHLLYMSVFLLPIVGLWLQLIINYSYEIAKFSNNKFVGSALVMCCLVLFGTYNAQKLDTIQQSYPNTTAVTDYIDNVNSTDTILSEDPYLYRYLLYGRVKQEQMNETTWLDNNKDGLHEIKDTKQAIWDRKFDYVYLNDQQHVRQNHTLRTMLAQRGYMPVIEHDYQLKTMSGEPRTGTLGLYKRTDQLVVAPEL